MKQFDLSKHATEFEIIPGNPYLCHNGISIRRVMQEDSKYLWKIGDHAALGKKSLKFELEPMPSYRDEAYIKEFRYKTPQQALKRLTLYLQAMDKQAKRGEPISAVVAHLLSTCPKELLCRKNKK